VVGEGPPIEVPKDVKWSKPETVVTASPKAAADMVRGKAITATATFVQDGDTAKMKDKVGNKFICRIDTIDAPETAKPRKGQPDQAFGPESKRTLQQLIENKDVTVRITKAPDKNGRQFCQIEVQGARVDEAMLKSGAAWLYERYVKEFTGAETDALTKAQNDAKKNRRGLWADTQAIPPEQFRRLYPDK
jgi:micrococcal nuclease